MRMSDFVVRESISPDLKAANKEAVIREMVDNLRAAGYFKGSEPEDIVKAQELIAAHAGRCPLILCFMRPEGGSVFIEPNSRYNITPSLELEHEVNRRFGDKSYYAVVDKALPEKARRAWEKKPAGGGGDE